MPPLAPAHLSPENALEPLRPGDDWTIHDDWCVAASTGCGLHPKGKDMSGLTRKETADRSKINLHQPHEVRYWTRHLNISQEELCKAIDKVGNAAAAVRKELGID